MSDTLLLHLGSIVVIKGTQHAAQSYMSEIQNELMVEIYLKNLARAIGKVTHEI